MKTIKYGMVLSLALAFVVLGSQNTSSQEGDL